LDEAISKGLTSRAPESRSSTCGSRRARSSSTRWTYWSRSNSTT